MGWRRRLQRTQEGGHDGGNHQRTIQSFEKTDTIRKEIAAQFPKAAEFVVSDTAPIKTFDNLEVVVRFLYHSGCQKDSVLLVVGNRQVKELGGFIAASYYCGIAYLYVPLTREASLYDTSDSCGVDLMGMPDVLQSCYAPCMVFRDEAVFELSYHDV